MKPYGLPRNFDAAYPDCADVRLYGRSSKFGRLTPAVKANYRRLWKRRARRDNQAVIAAGLLALAERDFSPLAPGGNCQE
jgi:hypothetical protein